MLQGSFSGCCSILKVEADDDISSGENIYLHCEQKMTNIAVVHVFYSHRKCRKKKTKKNKESTIKSQKRRIQDAYIFPSLYRSMSHEMCFQCDLLTDV
jgi:hypothetical protein